MAALVSKKYGEAIDRIRDNPIFTALVYRVPMIAPDKRITDLTDAEMAEHDIAHYYERDWQPTSTFMMAAGKQFAAYEEANPQYRDEGFRAIGTIAQAMLAVRKDVRNMAKEYGHLSDEELDARLSEKRMCDVMGDVVESRLAEMRKEGKDV